MHSDGYVLQESTRSKVYVAMDFSGKKEGRILDNPRDVRACDKASSASKDGYVPFRYTGCENVRCVRGGR